jgi:hypothetical protein
MTLGTITITTAAGTTHIITTIIMEVLYTSAEAQATVKTYTTACGHEPKQAAHSLQTTTAAGLQARSEQPAEQCAEA